MTKLFFSYSHADEQLRDRLEQHLAILRRQGLIESWHDRRIQAGSPVDDGIFEELDQAGIILLLVSASFIASDYCYSREMARAMERHASGSAVVIPVILRPCLWQSAPFGKLMAAPKDGKPVEMWPNHDEAFTDVARRIEEVVRSRGSRASAAPAQTPRSRSDGSSTGPASLPRSSNLRMRKDFTDRDKDKFLNDSFEYAARFFEGSLAELEKRHSPEIATEFRRIDANSFTAVVYRHGKSVSQCAITLGGFGGRGITYSHDASSRGGSFNEMVSVEADDQSLFLRSMGMQFGHGNERAALSQEGAAEQLWSMLMRPLQQ